MGERTHNAHASGSGAGNEVDSPDRPVKKRRTNVGKACEPCRRRRCKCDGKMPACTTCAIYKDDCYWDPREDYRKPLSRKEIKALSTRVLDLERILKQHGVAFEKELEGERSEDGSATDRRSKEDGAEPADSRQWSQDHLVEGETGDLRVYGPTSAFRHLGKYSQDRVDGLVTYHDSPPASPTTLAYGYAKHLPRDVYLTEEQHDIALDRFFRYYACWGQRTNPILFMRDLDVALHTNSHSKTPHYSPMLHNAILAIGLGFSDEAYLRAQSTRKIFASKAKEYIDHEGMRPTVATAQALAHLASYHSLSAEHNLGWLYIGMAVRCGVALGLNIDDARMRRNGNIPPDQARERNNTFWTVYIQEAVWAPYIGRSISVPEYTTRPPSIDEELDQLPWESKEAVAASPLLGARPCLISTNFVETVKLMKIAERIMSTLYGLKADMSALPRSGVINEIGASLSEWLDNLPAGLKLDGNSPSNGMPHILMLHLSYAWLVILLHRPFYRPLAGISRERKPHKSVNAVHSTAAWAVKQCDQSASNIIRLLQTWHRLHDLRFCPPTAFQCCFIAGTTYLLSLTSAENETEQSEALDRARQCIDLLALMAVSWPAAGHQRSLLENLLAEYGLSVVSQRSTNTVNAQEHGTSAANRPPPTVAANYRQPVVSPPAAPTTTSVQSLPPTYMLPTLPALMNGINPQTRPPQATHTGQAQYPWDGNMVGPVSQTLLAQPTSEPVSAPLLPPLQPPVSSTASQTQDLYANNWNATPFDFGMGMGMGMGMGELDPDTQALLDNILRPHLDVGMTQPWHYDASL